MSQITASGYAISRAVDMSYDQAVQRARETLKEQGFGVLTEIDVKKTMKEKIGVDVEPYIILGACNPNMAHQALNIEPEIGVLLPCNIIVYLRNGSTIVAAMDPVPVLGMVGSPELEPIAMEVRTRLKKAVDGV